MHLSGKKMIHLVEFVDVVIHVLPTIVYLQDSKCATITCELYILPNYARIALHFSSSHIFVTVLIMFSGKHIMAYWFPRTAGLNANIRKLLNFANW
jgi:hypothetical protein